MRLESRFAGAGRSGRSRSAHEAQETLDFVRVRDRVGRRRKGAPQPAKQRKPRNVAPLEDKVDDGGNILDRGVGAHDRWIGVGLLRHLLRPRGFAVAAQIEQIDVVTAGGDVIHPRQAAEPEIERGVRRIGRAMHEQQCALGPERRHVGGPLVADIDLDAGIERRHHEFLGLQFLLHAGSPCSPSPARCARDLSPPGRGGPMLTPHAEPSVEAIISCTPSRFSYTSILVTRTTWNSSELKICVLSASRANVFAFEWVGRSISTISLPAIVTKSTM